MAVSPTLIETGKQGAARGSFRVSKASLLKELNISQGVTEKKNTIPILSSILLEADAGELSIVATDLDASLRTSCPAEVEKKFACVIQARKLFDIVRNLPDGEIFFTLTENDRVVVTSGQSEFVIVGQAREHFPSVPYTAEFAFKLPGALLNSLITRTIFAITQEESRYALNGSLFFLSGGKLLFVSTDGHRLSMAQAAVDVAAGEEVKVIIPKKALTELQKLTAGGEHQVEFARDDNHIYFKVGNRLLTTRTLAGQFPNYELVLPKNNDKQIAVKTALVNSAVRRAALMADERSHGVSFTLKRGLLQLSAHSADVGEAKDALGVEYAGDGLTIGFNANYLTDFFGVVGAEEITFEFKDDQSPVLLRPAGESATEFSYVVMPMRLL